MRIDPEHARFIDDPDTIDIILRKNEYLLNYFIDNPDFLFTQTLGGRYVVVYLNRSNVKTVANNLGAAFVNAEALVFGLLDMESIAAAGIYQVQQQPYLNLTGKGVLIGFVDTGIDYTQEIFKYEDGTSRIRFLYDQTVRGNLPDGFFIGTEYTNEQINEALKAENPYDIVPQQDTVGHGTFLASVAAGSDDRVGMTGAAPDSELIVVKLRKARPFYLERYLIPPEQENVYSNTDIMIGIEYILNKAIVLNRPVAICIGLGTNQGAHNGSSILEEYLSQIATVRGVCICTAAGNESQARHHFQGILKSEGEEQNIDIQVGDNAGSFSVSIRNSAADRISVSVRSPTGELVGRVPAVSGSRTEEKMVLEKSSIIIEYFFPIETTGGQLTIVRIVNATPGLWTIIVNGDIVLDGLYHAWLPLTGLVSPNIEFLEPSPYTTIVVPATAYGVITTGAYDAVTNSLYPDSSWGPTRATLLKPDFVAPGVDVGGIYPSGYDDMSGTSVATAISTGAGALLLQWGVVNKNEISISTYHIRAYLIRGCTRIDPISYPNQRWGYGSINLIQTFELMREV